MPRGKRVIIENGTFHITARGNNKRRLFQNQHEYRKFKKLILHYKEKWQFSLYHYALMNNHIHLLIKANQKTDISKMMQGLLLSYNRFYKKRWRYTGHLWQGRFFSRVIPDEPYLITSGLYIDRNPVDAGIVNNPGDYPWTSFRHYALGETDPLVDTSPIYKRLGRTEEDRQQVYLEIMTISIERAQTNKKCNEWVRKYL